MDEPHVQRGGAKRPPYYVVTLLVALLSPAAALTAELLTNWKILEQPVKWTAVGLIGVAFAASMTVAIVHMFEMVQRRYSVYRMRQQCAHLLMKYDELIRDGRSLFEDNRYGALLNYIQSVLNCLSHHENTHTKLNDLLTRLRMLSSWHASLGKCQLFNLTEPLTQNRVNDITIFYHSLADVVRDFNCLDIPEEPALKGLTEALRMVKSQYNSHLEELERLLRDTNMLIPSCGRHVFFKF